MPSFGAQGRTHGDVMSMESGALGTVFVVKRIVQEFVAALSPRRSGAKKQVGEPNLSVACV